MWPLLFDKVFSAASHCSQCSASGCQTSPYCSLCVFRCIGAHLTIACFDLQLCCLCSRRWDTGSNPSDPSSLHSCGPMNSVVAFWCNKCKQQHLQGCGEFPLCLECARRCIAAQECPVRHELGTRNRGGPSAAYRRACHLHH